MDLEDELEALEAEIVAIDIEINDLRTKRSDLERRKREIENNLVRKASEELSKKDWERTDFPWSSKLVSILQEAFKLSSFRPHQLSTINALLSGHDVLLIMPTGGGKSLCYQLPGLVTEKGFTLVVSPLVSLMEDQIMSLTRIGVDAALLNASSTKEDVNRVHNAMTDVKSPLRLIYVTPEKLAKSKRFMAKLQKGYALGLFKHLAIDEVHCCSQWGHDFRPDYKFLGIMKNMFPKVPIIGLTATSTAKVTSDVQEILNIKSCLIFKASFNRPNLYYEVRQKPETQEKCLNELENLLSREFKGQSGIIYTLTIKDAETLTTELRSRGLKVGCYHANLDSAYRSKIHRKWIAGDVQAVIATIAFGMGIDKPDVRFVIHHSMSKSMENFYQESGRAGRDDKPAKCIVFYRFADIFRISTMVFTEKTGLEKAYGIVSYCIDTERCRRNIIADHFDENWESRDCQKSCDHCRDRKIPVELNVIDIARAIMNILRQAASGDSKLTALKLVEATLGRGASGNKISNWTPAKDLNKEVVENILAFLLLESFVKEDFHFTPYNTISYIVPGPRGNSVFSLSELKLKLNSELKTLKRTKEAPEKKVKKKAKVHQEDDELICISD